jgi:hypothetical protein
MSDPISAAKSARESLARALGALQSDPSVPPQLMAIAEPVSNAMGALFQIERSGGGAAATSGPVALEAVRRALALLQQQPSNHPAVQLALEAVAGSLGTVHGLASGKIQAAAAPAQKPQAAPYAQPTQPQAAYPQPQQPAYAQPPQGYAPQQQGYAPPAAGPGYGAPVQSPQAYAATYVAPSPPAAQQAYPPPQQAYPPPQQAYQPPQQAQPPARPAAPAQAPAGGGVRVEAELGAHSPSNFYKGLSGNDVVDHGGLFIATYNIPRVGQPITVHVSMPGGYEFDAAAVVKWTRETVDSSHGQTAPPGFGAQFTQITPEARQLVYRYVRNREPLFHDDL